MPDGLFSVLSQALGVSIPGLKTLAGPALGWSEAAIGRHVTRHFVPALLRKGYSGNQILGLFKDAGHGIRRQDFLQIARESREINASQDAARAVGPGDRINTAAARQIDKWGESEFAARLRVEWTDVETGEYRSGWITIDIEEGERLVDVYERAGDMLGVWCEQTVGGKAEQVFSMELGDIIRHRV